MIWAKRLMLKMLKAEHLELNRLLASRDSQVVKGLVERHWSPDIDDRMVWPRVYTAAEQSGVMHKGWKLRFLMYYWAGVKEENWD